LKKRVVEAKKAMLFLNLFIAKVSNIRDKCVPLLITKRNNFLQENYCGEYKKIKTEVKL